MRCKSRSAPNPHPLIAGLKRARRDHAREQMTSDRLPRMSARGVEARPGRPADFNADSTYP